MVSPVNDTVSITSGGDLYLGRTAPVVVPDPDPDPDPQAFNNMLLIGHSLIGENYTHEILKIMAEQISVPLTTSQTIVNGVGGLEAQMHVVGNDWQNTLVTPELDCIIGIATNPIDGHNRWTYNDSGEDTDLLQMGLAKAVRDALGLLNSQKVNPTDPDKTVFLIETWRDTTVHGGGAGDWLDGYPAWPVLNNPIDWAGQITGTDQANQIIIRDGLVAEGHDMRMIWAGSLMVELEQLLGVDPTHFGSSINFHTDILGDGVHLSRTGSGSSPSVEGGIFARWIFCWIIFTFVYNRTPMDVTDVGAVYGEWDFPIAIHPWITEQTKTNIREWIWDRYINHYRDL